LKGDLKNAEWGYFSLKEIDEIGVMELNLIVIFFKKRDRKIKLRAVICAASGR